MTCFNYLLYHALLGNAYSIYLFNGNNQESWLCRRDTFLPKNLVKVLVYITRNKNCHFVGEARGVATRLSPANFERGKRFDPIGLSSPSPSPSLVKLARSPIEKDWVRSC